MYASEFWRIHAKTSRGIVTTIRMKNGAVIELEAAWALNTLEVDEAKTSLCGTKAGADMKDGLRINYIHHNKQVVKPAQAAVVTRVLEAIYESAKSGKTIYFD